MKTIMALLKWRIGWNNRSTGIGRSLLAAVAVLIATTATHHIGAAAGTTATPSGRTFAALPAGSGQLSLINIHMNNGTSGWAMSPTALLRTVDGGSHWHAVTPSGLKMQPNFVPAASYLNPNTAWISDGFQPNHPGIFRTTNGGQTWQHTTLPLPGQSAGGLDIKQIDFIDAKHGWILENLGGGAGTFYFALLHTADGGAHWSTVADGNQSPPAQGAYPRNVQGIGFQNTSNGWTTVVIPAGPQLSGMYRTTDGGHIWQRVTLPMSGAFQNGFYDVEPPAFFSANKGATVVASETAVGLYVTSNGGATWAPTTPLHLKVSFSVANPLSANVIDQTHAWVAVNSSLYFTSDLGRHWTSLA
ncbi:MAG: hypothetical protein JWO59_313, partial [Chloroflexi bacterium]|nr:hypothetical protein [Chloroflexota bacterium]